MPKSKKTELPESPIAAQLAAQREALEYALASHNNKGKAQLCDCSLCLMMRAALKPGGGNDFVNRIRDESLAVVTWKIAELERARADRSSLQTARDIADLLRVLALPR